MSEGTFVILVLGLGGLAALYFLAVRPLIDFMLRIIRGKENLNKLGIKERVIQTLKEMSCNPDEINENEDGNDAIIFNFQDQNFIIYVDGSPLVRIYCTWWAKLDLNDENIPILKEAINEYNLGEFYQFNLSSCIRQQNSLTAQFVSFSFSNLANIFYTPNFYNN